MSSIRGTTSSGSSSSRDRNAPSTEPAFAALAGPVTSVRGKRSNVGSGADGKVAPANRRLTEVPRLEEAPSSRAHQRGSEPPLRQQHRPVLQLPSHARAG